MQRAHGRHEPVEETGMGIEKRTAILDSGTIDHVADPNEYPGTELKETPGSLRGDSWIGAGNHPTRKLGEFCVPWRTKAGESKRMVFKAGKVGQTLISTQKLRYSGWETLLTLDSPKLNNPRTGEWIPINCVKGSLPTIDMWIRVPVSNEKNPKVNAVDVTEKGIESIDEKGTQGSLGRPVKVIA